MLSGKWKWKTIAQPPGEEAEDLPRGHPFPSWNMLLQEGVGFGKPAWVPLPWRGSLGESHRSTYTRTHDGAKRQKGKVEEGRPAGRHGEGKRPKGIVNRKSLPGSRAGMQDRKRLSDRQREAPSPVSQRAPDQAL